MTNYFTFFLMDKFAFSVQGRAILPLRIPRGIGRQARSSAGRWATASDGNT